MDSDSLRRVIKVECKSLDPNLIRGIFSRCGPIRGLYPHTTSTSDTPHFFIDFKDDASFESALNVKLNNSSVQHIQAVARHPDLIEQYRTVNPFAFDTPPQHAGGKRSISEMNSALGGLDHDSDTVKCRNSRHGGTSRIRRALTEFRGGNPSRPLCSSPSGPLPLLLSPNVSPSGVFLQRVKPSETPVSNPEDENMFSSKNASRTDSFPLAAPPTVTIPLTPYLSFSLETRIQMALCGESITYDLESLDADPRAIIELLRITASERGNWMTVGAYYRRTGKANAAISVLMSMIEVMTQHNVTEDDLKPAFLMLSGCENDLKKCAPASEVSEHARKSQEWLQKVYGVNSPVCEAKISAQLTNALGPNVTDPVQLDPAAQSNRKNSNTQLTSAPPTCVDACIPSVPRRHPAPVTPAPTQFVNDQASLLRNLEREIQTLRDHHAHQSTLLSRSRAAKRSLENDLAREHSLRQKLERRLAEAEQDLKKARRAETYALDQMKREMEMRKKAEEKAELERGMRAEAEKAAEKKTIKPLFEDLANMFQRAAQGEGVLFPGLGSQAGRASHSSSTFPAGVRPVD